MVSKHERRTDFLPILIVPKSDKERGLVGFHEKKIPPDLHCAADWQYTVEQREMCCFYMQQAAEMSLTSVLAQENGRGPRNSS